MSHYYLLPLLICIMLIAQAAVAAPPPQNQGKVEVYLAELEPLNNSGVTGRAIFMIVNESVFIAKIHATGHVATRPHAQHIHTDADCPPASAAGADGVLTIGEGLPFYGPVFIPLDANLTSLSDVSFPSANPAGVLNYANKTSVNMLATTTGGNLNLQDRTVVLHGDFVNGTFVPSLPVACGEIVRVR